MTKGRIEPGKEEGMDPGLKVAILVPDGAADFPLDRLGGKTPLEAARKPNMDRIAREGSLGTARTVPPGIPPGSDVANLALMGYDPVTHYGGRAPIEAANLDVDIPDGWTAFRCNLVKASEGRMLDYSADHISQADAERSMRALAEALDDEQTRFFPGTSYRNITLLKGDYSGLRVTPPHDITGEPYGPHLPEGEGAERVNELMRASAGLLEQAGSPANMIWLWGQGTKLSLEPFSDLYRMNGYVISAVDLVFGIAKLAGLSRLVVPGANAYLDTDYEGKGRAAIVALENSDFVFVHVEAPDEASHLGDAGEKVKAIERFDEAIVGPVLETLEARAQSFRLMVAPDHFTLITTRTHDATPVPFGVIGTDVKASGAEGFTEAEAAAQGFHVDEGWKLVGMLKDWKGASR